MAHILVVEDDATINDVVTTCLTQANHTVVQAFSGSEARLILEKGTAFDVLICDLMLPGATGEELIAFVRSRTPSLPILVISARDAVRDRVELLRLGADDYLTKPFDLDELVARVEVQIRHSADTSATSPLIWKRWSLDPQARTLTIAGTTAHENSSTLELTRREYGLLELLISRPNRVFSKSELFEGAWNEPFYGDDAVVTQHISNIRAKLRATNTDDYIKTVWGMGFKLA